MTRALISHFLYNYYASCTGMRAEDWFTEEGFRWELERHGHWPLEEMSYLEVQHIFPDRGQENSYCCH